MNIHELPSPNFDSREGHEVDMLVLHYTGMPTAQDALTRMCDPVAKVSAHYVVEEDGRIHALVPEEMRAWHAGKSFWRGHNNINQRSIGIEIVNPGHEFGYRTFPEAQMHAVIQLCKATLSRHPIPARNVVGHSDVAPMRKLDPGELFDWEWLAREGVGLPSCDTAFAQAKDVSAGSHANSERFCAEADASRRMTMLHQYGFDTTDLAAAITAFQRHFRQSNISGEWDVECENIVQNLLLNE
jgi:N-acetylmuramoyl-L-alanine amidase